MSNIFFSLIIFFTLLDCYCITKKSGPILYSNFLLLGHTVVGHYIIIYYQNVKYFFLFNNNNKIVGYYIKCVKPSWKHIIII